MSVWFTSDLHLGHRFVAGTRGFVDVETHDYAICRRWAEAVRDDDDVWVLGDLAASSPIHALDLIQALPGRKHLISGNHDKCHPMHRDAHNWQGRYLEVFASVQAFARRKVAGQPVLLSHFPYKGDHTAEDRHTQYRLRDEGEWLLHGHTHSDSIGGADRQMHVGVDAWDLRPVSLDQVAERIAGRGG